MLEGGEGVVNEHVQVVEVFQCPSGSVSRKIVSPKLTPRCQCPLS